MVKCENKREIRELVVHAALFLPMCSAVAETTVSKTKSLQG